MPAREELLNNLDPVTNPAEGLTCPICDPEPPVDLIRLPCHETHIYCQACITLWLQQRGVNTCPQCRTELFDLPQAELPAEDDEDDEDYDDVDEDGARVVDLDEDFHEYEDDEDDNGSLAGDYHVEDDHEDGDELDPREAGRWDDDGGEDSNARERRQSALSDELMQVLDRPPPRLYSPGPNSPPLPEEEDQEDTEVQDGVGGDDSNAREQRQSALLDELMSVLERPPPRLASSRRYNPGVHRSLNPLPSREEADQGDPNAPDADDQDGHRDRAPYPRQRWRQQWRRHRRYDSNDEDEEGLVADEVPPGSLPRPSSPDAGADEINSTTNPRNSGTEASNGKDDEVPEPDSARNRSAEEQEPEEFASASKRDEVQDKV
ncbi:hypothetical protein PRZ48_009899 [Zasmidium cellare]|uniref:RING-type domain-containing protein n=1 Tax=Zasmidium cellare TaxID=395010 RepID=A0ABR0ED11_ZASCE|nr:hypothetical protein PRZ48_009899 [Zasmidium cellare]